MVYGDCNDFSQLLCIAFEANGIDASVRWMKYMLGNGDFITNLMCPAGFDSTMVSLYNENDFTHHKVVAPDGIAGDACSDASSSYLHNLFGGPHLNPVDRWLLPNYWRKEIGSLTVGLANRPANLLVPPGTPYHPVALATNYQAFMLF